jgi:hypothetical protein
MTDAVTAPITLEPLGAGPTYTRVNIWLPQLLLEALRTGASAIENRRFEGCLFEGPAVVLPIEGCEFDGCDLGETKGDPRSLMLAPQGANRVVGPIPFRHCQFINCRFVGVGFTGAPAFLDSMAQAISGGAAQ